MSKSSRDVTNDDWLGEEEGQLAVDVYQTDESIVIKAPIAGVDPNAVNVTITDEVVTIEGERHDEETVEKSNYFAQECYWGKFSRSFVLPVAVDADAAEASLKHGILIIRIPKQAKTRARSIKVLSTEE